MTEEKKEREEFPPIKEFKDGEWYRAWFANIKTQPNKWESVDAIWGFALCDKVEGEEKRRYANFFTTSVRIPSYRKISKLYQCNKKGEPSNLKRVLTAFQLEDVILKKLGGTTLEIEAIQKAIADMIGNRTIYVKLRKVDKGDKYYLNAVDVRADVDRTFKKIDEQQEKKVSKKAPAKLGG